MSEKLALFGGRRTADAPFPGWPRFSDKSLAGAQEPLRAGRVGYWTGTCGRSLEAAWAAWCGARRAVSCANGTAALHLALLALGIGPGDEVIVPSHTFVATPFSVLHAGGVPVFADVTADQTLDPRAIGALCTERTRAVIAVHLFGVVCDMDAVLREARARGLAVVEDCAQCAGGEYGGRKAGVLGDAGCFSFHYSKHVSAAGEGGMVVTDDDAVAEVCRSLRDHGEELEPSSETAMPVAGAAHAAAPGAAALLQEIEERSRGRFVRAGFNYRMTEVQAAVALGELERLESWNLARRIRHAKTYDHAFSHLTGIQAVPLNTEKRRNAYWRYPLQLDLSRLACDAGGFRDALFAEGIPCGLIPWLESYREPALKRYAGDGSASPPCPLAERLDASTVCLLLHPTWERNHIDMTVSAVKKVLAHYRR